MGAFQNLGRTMGCSPPSNPHQNSFFPFSYDFMLFHITDMLFKTSFQFFHIIYITSLHCVPTNVFSNYFCILYQLLFRYFLYHASSFCYFMDISLIYYMLSIGSVYSHIQVCYIFLKVVPTS
jgi:hypothetical protein